MKRLHLVATQVVMAVAFVTTNSVQALEQSKPPLIRDTGGTGSSPGPGDPSLGGTRMPPGGDKQGVDAAERAEKAAERRAKAAEKKKEEERRKAAQDAAAAAKKNNEMKHALSSPILTRQTAKAVPSAARVASAPALTSTTAAPRHAPLAPFSLSR